MKIICGNCQKIMRGEDELKTVFPDVPDLLQRISPGEPVPIGECPDCGAVVHAEEEQPTLVCSVCGDAVAESNLRERRRRFGVTAGAGLPYLNNSYIIDKDY